MKKNLIKENENNDNTEEENSLGDDCGSLFGNEYENNWGDEYDFIFGNENEYYWGDDILFGDGNYFKEENDSIFDNENYTKEENDSNFNNENDIVSVIKKVEKSEKQQEGHCGSNRSQLSSVEFDYEKKQLDQTSFEHHNVDAEKRNSSLTKDTNQKAKTPKKKIQLNDNQKKFKHEFYAIFTTKEKFPKKHVKDIHNSLICPQLNFPRMTRNEIRSINLYFINYCDKKDQILQILSLNKEAIKAQILSGVKKLK